MRKVIAMLLVIVMLFGMMPAGTATEVEDPAETPSVSEPVSAEEAPTEEEPAEEPAAEEPAEEPAAEEPTEEPAAEEPAEESEEEEKVVEDSGTVGGEAETLTPPGGGGVSAPGERYYHANHKFGFDSMTNGGTVTGVTVSVGSTTLTEGDADSTNAAALENGVTITFQPGYYLHSYKIVCGDKYSCNTDAQGLAVSVSNVMSGATQASYKVTLTKTALGHSSEKGPYWILLDIRQDNVKYKVTYNWGILEGVLTNDAPATETHLVNDVVTVKEGDADAIAQAEAMGYRFIGWSNSVSGATQQPGDQFGMPAKDVELTALWEEIPLTYTVTKVWADGNDQDGIRPDSVQIQLYANGAAYGDPVTVTGSGSSWTYTWTNLPRYIDGRAVTYSADEVSVPDGYTKSVSGSTITNTHAPEVVSVSGAKTWDDADNQDGIRPESITISLLADGVVVDTITVTADDGWKWSFANLPKYSGGTEIKYTISEAEVDGYTASVDGYNVTNTYTPETVSVSGIKTWDDADNQDGIRPESITIKLLANGEVVQTITVTEEDGWAWSFTDLPKYAAGEEITYEIQEEAVSGYTPVYDGYNVTNTHTPSTVTVAGAKTWDDNNDQDGKRPDSITITLKADGEVIDTVTVTAEDGWAWSFENLPEYKDGVKIVYTIEEGEVADYTVTVNGYNVTNTHIPEKINISGTKTWDDADNQDGIRPESITINLLANGEVVETITVTEEDDWKWSFNDLPKYADGQEIQYTITEETVDGYETIVKDFDVTNSHTPSKITIEGEKTWDDNNDQDGIRPASITVRLLADGEEVASVTVTAEDGWKWSFADMPEFKAGVRIVYTVAEDTVEGYTASVDGYNVTNTHTPETISIEGTKTWEDNNDQDGIRPASITINLLANGEVVDTITVTEEDDWKWTFTDLPKYAAGEEIVYTVEEEAVEGYTATVDGYNVTNTHTPETISIEGTKTWEDNNDQDGKRPESITVRLLADGEEVASVTVTAEDGWAWSFEGLPKYAGGTQIVYTVTEDAVEGYTASVDGYNITNTHTPETVTIEGGKTWQDNNDQDGIRPDSITVNLLADGEKVASMTVTAEDEWKWSFTDLPKYADGVRIVYTIEEVEVAGYTTTVVGYNVINVHIPETITISGTKTWDDGNDQDGIRPGSITVNLLANGVKVDSVEVKASLFGSWKYTFRNLPKYENGVEIVYTVEEEAVEGYTTKVEGFDITNTHETEKTELNVKKVWDDKNDENKKRPTSVKITLYANGKSTGKTLVLSAANNWAGTFKELEKNAGGKAIKYTVKEETVSSYKATYTYSGSNATVTNTFSVIPVTGDVSGLYGHILLMGISAAAVVVLGIIGKRRYLF